MKPRARKITLEEWDVRYEELRREGLREAPYGGPLRRHVRHGDTRLLRLLFDDSPAALRLWNFVLSEEERLWQVRREGRKLVGTMKDLGTVPVMVYSLPDVVAFYPDGAWWTPCIMEHTDGVERIADSLGIGESFCPVRAMLGAFVAGDRFPIPDLLTCSVGAVCDDFSAIAQRLEGLGHTILWWEIPARRAPDSGESWVRLPGGMRAPVEQLTLVKSELNRIRQRLEDLAGHLLTDEVLADGIRAANDVRRKLAALRNLVYASRACVMPALEMLLAEMLAIHFCSDREETAKVVDGLLLQARTRLADGTDLLPWDAVRVFWVNPVADLRAMNLLEESGGRLCGSDFMFLHALCEIPSDCPPMDALARCALTDPMAGTISERAMRICVDARHFGAEAVIVSRIPGASHCAYEARLIHGEVQRTLGLPVVEIEIPPVSDALSPAVRTRMEALVESARARRSGG